MIRALSLDEGELRDCYTVDGNQGWETQELDILENGQHPNIQMQSKTIAMPQGVLLQSQAWLESGHCLM